MTLAVIMIAFVISRLYKHRNLIDKQERGQEGNGSYSLPISPPPLSSHEN